MKEVNFENMFDEFNNMSFEEFYNYGKELQEELRRDEAYLKSLKAFCPSILEDKYNKLSSEEKKKYFSICPDRYLDITDELKTINSNLKLMNNLLINNKLLEAEKEIKHLRNKVKCFNEYFEIRLSYLKDINYF